MNFKLGGRKGRLIFIQRKNALLLNIYNDIFIIHFEYI